MSKNYNEKSRRIIKNWYLKAKNPVESPGYDHFDRFISLWISFNCYFVSEFYDELKYKIRRDPSEYNYLSFIVDRNDFKSHYSHLIENVPDFKKNLEYFQELLKQNRFPGAIADLRPHRIKQDYAKRFDDIHSFEQFIWIVYQVRCNLFHGNKNPNHDDDIEIVKTIFDSWMDFITAIYKEEGYLHV